jgi:alpha-beta hydrolase superfamily lysophospholipase
MMAFAAAWAMLCAALVGGAMAPATAAPGAALAAVKARPPVSGILAAAGVRQFADCRGPLRAGLPTGPTVVLVSGLGASSAYWGRVRAALLPTTRVCVYDRPGLGYSPARSAARVVDAGIHAAELAGLLTAAHETGPLVIVGHSYGGLLVRAFAIRYPSRVAAVMMLDASYADQWRSGSRYWPEPRARIDMLRTQQIVWGLPRLGHKPLIVMTAGIGSSSHWLDRQRAMARMSADVEHVIIPRSSHVIQQHDPAAVVYGVTLLVRSVRDRAALPPCSALAPRWAAVGARCVR